MRQIKFRAWDKDKKKMIEQCPFQSYHEFVLTPGGIPFDLSGSGKVQPYELMQFTGLHDKNGKEIYEGDVVRYNHVYLDHPVDFEVMFDEGGFGQRRIDGEEVSDWYEWEELEVIGNIYENPELLKEDTNE